MSNKFFMTKLFLHFYDFLEMKKIKEEDFITKTDK